MLGSQTKRDSLSRDASAYNRWVEAANARGLVQLALSVRNDCGICKELPEELFTQFIPKFLHFHDPIPGMIYVLGGRASKVLEPEHYLSTAECYDCFRNEWIQLPPMMTKRVGASSISTVDGKVYIIGGYAKHPDKPLASGECFDPRTGEWKPIADLSQGRFGHSIAACGKYVFVIGGDSRRQLVSGIERYDCQNDKWETVGQLPRPVAGGRTLERDGKLYLVGGDIGSQPLSFTNTIRVFDPCTNKWEVLAETLSQGRSATACTWLAEGSTEIAVIGGYAAENDSFFELKSSEIIQTDPHGSNIAKGRSIPHLKEARAGCRAVTIGHRIFVIGGESPEAPKSQNMLQSGGQVSALSSSFQRPLSNVRDVLLQALQQRLTMTSGREGQQLGSVDEETTTRLAPVNRLQSSLTQAERKAHPVVAIFDTQKWIWEEETPVMAIPRTAASVCVGVGYPTSYGWTSGRRWLTDRAQDSELIQTSVSVLSRPQAASG
jgi:N-acetylneuraminic acid mutarotase